MNINSRNLKKLHPALSSFLIGVLVFGIGVFVACTLYLIEKEAHQIETKKALNIIKGNIQRFIGEMNKATDIYTKFITDHEGEIQKLESFSKYVLNTHKIIDLLSIYLKGKKEYAYPINADTGDLNNEKYL